MLKELIKEQGISFKDERFESHMTFENAGIRIDSVIIVWPGNTIDGKKLIRQVYTPRTKMKGWGKGEITWKLNEDKAPEFNTLEQLIKHYGNCN